jgi:uncharacterized protein (DUF885 family)
MFPLSDQMVDDMVEMSPMLAVNLGIRNDRSEWDDLSPDGLEAIDAMRAGHRIAIARLPPPVDRWDRLAREVAVEMIEEQRDEHSRGEDLRDLNSVASPFQYLRETLDLIPVDTPEDQDLVIRRIGSLDRFYQGLSASLEEGRGRGLTVARRQVESVIDQAEKLANEDGFQSLARRLPADCAERDRFADAVATAKTAASDFGDYLRNTYLGASRHEDGVGEERYIVAARGFLGCDIDPAEAYQWGWEEVSALTARARSLADQISRGFSPAEVVDMLRSDPEHAAATHEEFVRVMQDRQEAALSALEGVHFDVPSEIRSITINLAPPGTPLGAFYQAPTEDFSRPGGVWYSLPHDPYVPLYEEVSVAYHEGFPGHHLQIGTQMLMGDRLSRLHRSVLWYSGSGEGWALYAERLMEELGYFERPEYVLGMVVSHLLRACRVVIDIGCHVGYPVPDTAPIAGGERWSFDLGVKMLEELAFQPNGYAVSEVTRYLGWPGQAISYKLGERVILELRESEKRRLGERFSLRDFHDRVLEIGPVGLDLLTREVSSTDRADAV